LFILVIYLGGQQPPWNCPLVLPERIYFVSLGVFYIDLSNR
jgi:hypothetical protein